MKIGFVIDNLDSFVVEKDSTIMMMLSAQKKNWQIHTMELNDIWVENGIALGNLKVITLDITKKPFYNIIENKTCQLSELSAILMRKDPPFNMEYIYATYILELVEKTGTLVVNSPKALRDSNEKFCLTNFVDYAPETLIARNAKQIKQFMQKHTDIILKPLDGMGGSNIFRVKFGDANLNVIIENLTEYGVKYIMIQKFEKQIKKGDKRVLTVGKEVLPFVMARIPSNNDFRGNLAAGANSEIRAITNMEMKIATDVIKELEPQGVYFMGLDIIGDKLTEVNITSPTGIRQIAEYSGIDASMLLMDLIESKL